MSGGDEVVVRAAGELRRAGGAILISNSPAGRTVPSRVFPPNPQRHRALEDTLDLTHFLPLLLNAVGT